MSDSQHQPFYGWWIVATAALGLFLGSASIIGSSFSVFLRPLSEDLHTGRGAVSLAFTCFTLMSASSVVLAGRLVDRFGSKRVIVPSAILFALILLSGEAVPREVMYLYFFYLVLGAVNGGMGPMAYSRVISHWFDRRRGLAIGLMMIGFGAGASVMPSLSYWLIVELGWRGAYMVYGVAILALTVPVVTIVLRERPEEMGLLPDNTEVEGSAIRPQGNHDGLSVHEALRSRTFWLMAVSFWLCGATVLGCMVHVSSILLDRGSTTAMAALASSLMGAAMLVGRGGSGFLLDVFFAPYVAAIFVGGAGLGTVLLATTTGSGIAFFATILLGLAMGAEGDVIAYLTSRYFGLRSFGQIYGFAFAPFVLGGTAGPYLMGAAFDRTGSYKLALATFSVVTAISAVMMTRLGPYRYARKRPDESGPEPRSIEPGSRISVQET